ncbi:MAG: TraR/DksA C4-type zinc finger protein [Nitrospirae bacterium]|nr:TraR/DksA C4-type zinc finger protein [Nitrospirota bacterium]
MPTKKTTKAAKCAAPAAQKKSGSKSSSVKAKPSAAKKNDKKAALKSFSKTASLKKSVTSSANKSKKIKKPVSKEKKNTDQAKKTKNMPQSNINDLSERNERLRRQLLEKRQQLLQESKNEIRKYVSGEKRQLVETVLDDGDLSVVDLSEDINLKKLSTHKDMLTKIDIALRKITEGTYGICEECGEEISEARLKVMPFAIYCREDQEKKEIMEKLEREME